jgi:hypothetical protein
MYDEKTHAHIIGLFYKHLKEDGIPVFIKAAQRYAEQRGNRMALRALRDGVPLNFAAYMAYGEWIGTIPMEVSEERGKDDLTATVSTCPWAETFAEMGLVDCGMLYCKEIDRGIVRGFNPDLRFELKSLLHNSDHCVQVFKNIDGIDGIDSIDSTDSTDSIGGIGGIDGIGGIGGINTTGGTVPAPADGKRDWQYHCAHVFTTMAETAQAAGHGDIIDRVKADFVRRFGEAALEGIIHRGIDFNLP